MIKDGNFTAEELDQYNFIPCVYNGIEYASVQDFKKELSDFCNMEGSYTNRESHREAGKFSKGGKKQKGTPIPLNFERSGEYPLRVQIKLVSDFKDKKKLKEFEKEQEKRNKILQTSDKNIKKYYGRLKELKNKEHTKKYKTTQEKIQLWNNRANEANQIYGLSKYDNEIEVKKIEVNTIIFEGREIKF